MASVPRLKISTRIGMPGEGKGIDGFFAGVFKEHGGSKLFRHLDRFCPVKIEDLVASKEIKGNFKEFHILHLDAEQPVRRIVLIGLGDKKDFDRGTVRSTAAKAARTLRKVDCKSMAVQASGFGKLKAEEAAEAVVEGAGLGLWRYDKYLKEDKDTGNNLEELVFFCRNKKEEAAVRKGIQRGEAFSEGTLRARELASEPSNLLQPKDLVKFAEKLAKKHPEVSLKVMGEKELEKMGAGGILGVGQASAAESFLIDLEYKGAKKGGLSVATVGKGVTFDTGGISIKPSSGMHQMKYDMCGAATVLGALDAAATLGLPVNLRTVVPTAENMPGGSAYKPGDVLKMLSGHHVEVLNTDAEGRLLLADGLWYATRDKPDMVLDVATLTGSIIIALGHAASGVFSNTEVLPKLVCEAGTEYHEKWWPMPLFPEYKVHLTSLVADQTNDGGRPAGSCSAAMFLKPFADGVPWAHLDIAGTAWIEESTILYVHKPYLPKRGATGFGVRTLAGLLANLGEKSKAQVEKLRKQLAKVD